MKHKIGIIILALTILLAGTTSCENLKSVKEEGGVSETFILEDYYSRVPVAGDRYMKIVSGNGIYSISYEQEGVVSAEFVKSDEENKYGRIRLQGLSQGTTMVEVKDVQTDIIQKIEVTVISRYLTFFIDQINPSVVSEGGTSVAEIEEDMETKSPLKSQDILLLKGGQGISGEISENMFIFDSPEDAAQGKPLYEGVYKIEADNFNHYLVLNYKKEGEEITRRYTFHKDSSLELAAIIEFLAQENLNEPIDGVVSRRVRFVEDLSDVYRPVYPGLKEVLFMLETSLSPYEYEVAESLLD